MRWALLGRSVRNSDTRGRVFSIDVTRDAPLLHTDIPLEFGARVGIVGTDLEVPARHQRGSEEIHALGPESRTI